MPKRKQTTYAGRKQRVARAKKRKNVSENVCSEVEGANLAQLGPQPVVRLSRRDVVRHVKAAESTSATVGIPPNIVQGFRQEIERSIAKKCSQNSLPSTFDLESDGSDIEDISFRIEARPPLEEFLMTPVNSQEQPFADFCSELFEARIILSQCDIEARSTFVQREYILANQPVVLLSPANIAQRSAAIRRHSISSNQSAVAQNILGNSQHLFRTIIDRQPVVILSQYDVDARIAAIRRRHSIGSGYSSEDMFAGYGSQVAYEGPPQDEVEALSLSFGRLSFENENVLAPIVLAPLFAIEEEACEAIAIEQPEQQNVSVPDEQLDVVGAHIIVDNENRVDEEVVPETPPINDSHEDSISDYFLSSDSEDEDIDCDNSEMPNQSEIIAVTSSPGPTAQEIEDSLYVGIAGPSHMLPRVSQHAIQSALIASQAIIPPLYVAVNSTPVAAAPDIDSVSAAADLNLPQRGRSRTRRMSIDSQASSRSVGRSRAGAATPVRRSVRIATRSRDSSVGDFAVPEPPVVHQPQHRPQPVHANTIGGITRDMAKCGLNVQAVRESFLGTMTEECIGCKALYFNVERNTSGMYTRCCGHSTQTNIQLPNLQPIPDFLNALFTGDHPHSTTFLEHIRGYNGALSFASIGTTIEAPAGAGGIYYRIHGQMYHSISRSATSSGPNNARYAQLYFLDADIALEQRMNLDSNRATPRFDQIVMTELDRIIREISPFAQAYRLMRDVIERPQPNVVDIRMYFAHRPASSVASAQGLGGDNVHPGRLNDPVSNEIAAIYSSANGDQPIDRDICVENRATGALNRIPAVSPNCDPLTYTLFFPHGEQGWHYATYAFSQLRFYVYRLSVRAERVSIFYGRKLLQQYIVDAFLKVESGRLNYFDTHQRELRVESYRGLIDHCNRFSSAHNIECGLPVILPSTFTMGPRHMHQLYQDALTLVREFGRPEYFITFTCNPKWKEIHESLLPGQHYFDRPDIVSRVFYQKVQEFIKDITEKEVLGRVLSYVYVVEFQKRGLPHIHLIVTVDHRDRLMDTAQIDDVICAELPDRDEDPQLFAIISTAQLHGPCGVTEPTRACMLNGKCTKRYPKAYLEETVDGGDVNGYILYRRRNDGKTFVRSTAADAYVFSNKDVVPYNPYLSKKFNCHINVEKCSSSKAIKYMHKYIFKGCDLGDIQFDRMSNQGPVPVLNEITSFRNARYLSAPEAIWRLFEFKTNKHSHAVIRLPVHLPDMQSVYFDQGNMHEIQQNDTIRKTQLTEWFQLNIRDPNARQYLYPEIPLHYTWITGQPEGPLWRPRRRGVVISRMYTVYPRDVERFHLRMLLLHVRGAQSYEQLRTVDGLPEPCSTFQEACRARGLLLDDSEWVRTLTEAASYQMPSQLRFFFALICAFNQPNDVQRLFEQFRESLSEDYVANLIANNVADYQTVAYRYALVDIARCAIGLGVDRIVFAFAAITQQEFDMVQQVDNRPTVDRSAAEHCVEANRLVATLNVAQRNIFDTIFDAVTNRNPDRCNAFFVNAFAGAGKTYVLNTLIHAIRGHGLTTIACAFTGIAASLLLNGRTSHNVFKFPLRIERESVCNVRRGQPQYEEIRTAGVIIWDECTMVTCHALAAVDRLLKEITGKRSIPFGGKVIVLGGDWRQILPVIPLATRSGIVGQILKQFPHWAEIEQLELVENMRTGIAEREFSDWLKQLGNGERTNDCTHGTLPVSAVPISNDCLVDTENSLICSIFGSLDIDVTDVDSFSRKAILCPKNVDALRINELVLNKLVGASKTYFSADILIDEDNDDADANDNLINYPIEFLNSMTPSGLPPHKLNLKVGAVIMLLRNLCVAKGLCNGQRLIVTELGDTLVRAKILVGQYKDSEVWIPRIDMTSDRNDLPFKMNRRQFPVRLSFAMTINKAQGQTLEKVGISLSTPVFTHGQLYVALSRATSKSNVRMHIRESATQGQLCRLDIRCNSKIVAHNVVFSEVIQSR